jgi:uncharacterized protein
MMAKLLIDKGADVFVSSKTGLSPVWYACANNQKEIVELFLENGLDVNFSRPISENTDSMNSFVDFVTSTLGQTNDSPYNLSDSFNAGGESLLHAAVKSGFLSMVKLLISKGATVDGQDESGNTPLHFAAALGKKDIVKFLLDSKADTTLVNAKEQKAIDYSNVKGFNEITELILKFSPKGTVAPVANTAMPPVENAKMDVTDKKKALLDLKELMDAGILSKEEFDIEKAKVLAK